MCVAKIPFVAVAKQLRYIPTGRKRGWGGSVLWEGVCGEREVWGKALGG